MWLGAGLSVFLVLLKKNIFLNLTFSADLHLPAVDCDGFTIFHSELVASTDPSHGGRLTFYI